MARSFDRALNKLPRIKLDLSQIMLAADSKKDLVTFDSEIPATYYVGHPGDGIIVITGTHGYLRIDQGDIPQLIEELTEYADQLMVRSHL